MRRAGVMRGKNTQLRAAAVPAHAWDILDQRGSIASRLAGGGHIGSFTDRFCVKWMLNCGNQT